MPGVITQKQFAVILLATLGQEAYGLMTQIPEALLIEAKNRAINLGIQYSTIIAASNAVDTAVDVFAPTKLFQEGWAVLENASTFTEQAELGLLTGS